MAIEFQQTIPVLRIFDLDKARAFYCGFLGFTVEWEHRFSAEAPVYLSVVRGQLTLHLSEHHGDACPGSTVFVWMTGIEEFHAELMATGYPYNRPGLETTFYQSRSVEVIDPFGNRLRFNERLAGEADLASSGNEA